MKKFVLTTPPETFKREVIIPLHNGEEASLEMEFIYRSRSDYAKFIDEIIANAKKFTLEAPKTAEGALEAAEITMQSILSQQDDLAVDTIMKIAKGWELSDKFNKTTLREMQDKFPNAFQAINDAYRLSVVEGKLKN